METVKVYLVRKPSDFEEVKTLCQKYTHEAEDVLIEETVNLPPTWYEALCQRPLDSYIFLSGKGGYDDFGHRKVVAIKCQGKPTLYVDPSGSSYCRYMGVEIANHFQTKIEPNGYKGQVVCYDRECCLLYKEELDKIMGPDASTIVMDTNNDKEDRYKAYRRDRDAEGKVLDRFRDTKDPLKLVIVTSKLLTGFDAPILQVMYLDKPMKDHNLLQAICRTNRVYDDGKTHGLIVDYVGIFDDVARALDFDENNMRRVITNIEEVKTQFPALMRK